MQRSNDAEKVHYYCTDCDHHMCIHSMLEIRCAILASPFHYGGRCSDYQLCSKYVNIIVNFLKHIIILLSATQIIQDCAYCLVADSTLFINYNKECAKYSLVSKLCSNKQESSFHHTHCRCNWYCIKILQFYFSHHVFISFQSHFENITLFCLRQEKKHRLCFMCCRADKNHTSLWVI